MYAMCETFALLDTSYLDQTWLIVMEIEIIMINYVEVTPEMPLHFHYQKLLSRNLLLEVRIQDASKAAGDW